MYYTIASLAKLSALPGFPGLRANLGRLAKPDLVPKRTPFFDNYGGLDELFAVHDFRAEFYSELENSESRKAGPFNRSGFSEYRETLGDYFRYKGSTYKPVSRSEINAKGGTSLIDQAWLAALDYLRKHQSKVARMSNITEVVKRARRGTNLGLPNFQTWRQGTDIGIYVRRAARLIEGKEVRLYPFCLFHRSQPKGRKEWKDRVVWGSDHAETFAGLSILHPFLDAFGEAPAFAGWKGTPYVDTIMPRFLQTWPFLLDADVSGMDQSVSPTWMNLVFGIIQECFDGTIPDGLLRQLFEYYTTGGICTPDGIFNGIHGLPSGVALTNLIDTLVMLIFTFMLMIKVGKPLGMMILGDDLALGSLDEVSLDTVESLAAEVGLKISADKSSASEDVLRFLQRTYDRRDLGNRGGGVYSCYRTLGRLFYVERFPRIETLGHAENVPEDDGYVKFDDGFWVLVAYMKLENCKYHPKFRELVEFAMSGDRNRLDPNLIGGREKYLNDLRGYDARDRYSLSGVKGFRTYQLVTELLGRRSYMRGR